ncbi:hypothetical protein Pyn_17382 [Prunus yedoensis var. nudiflora]|uniref:Uncharacterized protein n=1 Tax=Prunus yedoensis var. nudiflora TaxID=2094558 RepID=A0A314YCJ3_PRUYE|nr:hypothetical protein Pyn_17382 [Prunus yedoensis var. nudiflora]
MRAPSLPLSSVESSRHPEFATESTRRSTRRLTGQGGAAAGGPEWCCFGI